jgi:signal transduction histidine kinase
MTERKIHPLDCFGLDESINTPLPSAVQAWIAASAPLLSTVPYHLICRSDATILYRSPDFLTLEAKLHQHYHTKNDILPAVQLLAAVQAAPLALPPEHIHLKLDKDLLLLRRSIVPLDLADNSRVFLVLLHDVSTAQQMQNKLQLWQNRYRDLSRLISDWVFETDRNLHITAVSAKIVSLLQKPAQELLGLPLFSIGVVAAPAKQAEDLEIILERHQIFENIRFIIQNEGKEHIFLLSALPFFDQHTGDFSGYRGAAKDITEQERLEQLRTAAEAELRASRELAETTNANKTKFFANLSHELRTPLNAINGFASLMKSEVFGQLGSPKYHEYLTDIENSAVHLSKLLDDILNVAKAEAGKLDMQFERDWVALMPLLDQSMRMIMPIAHGKKQEIMYETSLEKNYDVYVEGKALVQILTNLLSNAVKFSPDNTRITVSTHYDDSLTIKIRDNGVGMKPQDIPRALTPFEQLSHTSHSGGTGLGLAISKAIAEAHGGTLHIASALGKGTTVTVTLPPLFVKPQISI